MKKFNKRPVTKSVPVIEQPVITVAEDRNLQANAATGTFDVKDTISEKLTIADIQEMTVIQIHHFIRSEYQSHREFDELLDVYGRDEIQKKLMRKLGLIE